MIGKRILFYVVCCILSCGCKPLSAQNKEKTSQVLSGAYSGDLKKGSVLAISSNAVVAVKQLPKSMNQTADEAALTEFKAALYGRLRDDCAGGCHDQGTIPLASPGVDLAWLTVKSKGYITADPEASIIIKDIRARHNGVDAAWADELGPMIKAIADKLQSDAAATAAQGG